MIGIFDSGIGGVTVFREILKLMPNYKYIYYSDSINNPYGDKSEKELINITKKIVEYLISNGCQIIVIACNTASAICKDALRNNFNVPIIAIEPAYKLASVKGKTLIMATKGTIESFKFKELYQQYDNHETIIYECVGLANFIEQNNKELIKKYLNKNIKQFKGVKNVVLGCTHYPLIKDEIKGVLNDVSFFDGSIGVAKHLCETVKYKNLKESEQSIKFVDSSLDKHKEKRFFKLLDY